MTDTGLDPATLPLQTAAPDASVYPFTQTFPAALAPEVLWAEFTRALTNSPDAVLWANDVSFIRALRPPLAAGAVLAERLAVGGPELHYRLVRFEPPRLLEYASLRGHPLACSAVVTVERTASGSTLTWGGEYRGSEPQLANLKRLHAVFFGEFARRVRQLESTATTAG
ncbi:hypothetical protein BO221_24020 [Archangium sp. Cb G35]|uniref:SRPBCC family protein n=1 Tax=Archangium sp. Cb G35 TaxID=1920190 RepID=UPI0009356EDA|nr:SRPBCC family protein [Archangium sp. Cb G35]OJT21841.1 hypothetical protein BO221_24020 [Archangium sp. Cb G35]